MLKEMETDVFGHIKYKQGTVKDLHTRRASSMKKYS